MPASQEVQLARLLKPFPAARLERALYYVNAEANALYKRMFKLLLEPPTTPEEWRFEMDAIDTLLWSLVERCWEAKPKIELLAKDADRAYDATVNAAMAMLDGLREQVQEPEETAA